MSDSYIRPVPKKLSQVQELTQANLNAYLWTILEGKDYRVSLAAIIALVTKESLGLGNVDNTSDANKPISNATAQALSQKANFDEVVSLSAFDALASSLSTYVQKTELDTILIELNTILASKLDAQATAQAIQTATQPINSAISGILNRLTQIESGYVTAYVRTSDFEAALNALHLTMTTEFNTAILEQIEPFSLAMANYNSELSALKTEFDIFKAATEQRLTVLEQGGVGGAGEVSVGPNEW